MALWYWQYGSLTYSLHADEEAAAWSALGLDESGEAAVAGVQFADGRVIERPLGVVGLGTDWWPAYKAVEDRRYEEFCKRQREYEQRPPRPTRQIRDPFGLDQTVTVDANEPEWLGSAQPLGMPR